MGLFAQRSGEAGDDQLFATSTPVLATETFHKKLHLWAAVREGHVV
jgi:hypothetical protein